MSDWLQIIMGWLGYLALLSIVVSTVLGLLAIWNYRIDERDEPEVRELRQELEVWDSSWFLEDADIREDR